MYSNGVVQAISRLIFTAGFIFVTVVGFASAQTPEVGENVQKEPVDKSDSVLKESADDPRYAIGEIGAKKEPVPARSEFAVASKEEPTDLSSKFLAEVSPAETQKNPFSATISKKPAPLARQASGSEWQFAFAPYLYMTGMTGTIGARGATADVDLGFGDVIENLNLGLMGAFEARKGRLILTSDLIWIKLGEERETPGELFSSIKLGVNMFVFDPEIGYRLIEKEAGSFDVLGGVRIMSVETNLNFRAGILPAADFSERKTWATPVIGGHGVLNLSPKFFLSTKFDIGGGVGADFTAQFYGGGGYRITPKIALIGGYRYLKTDYDSEAGFVFDTSMNGILLGAKFSF